MTFYWTPFFAIIICLQSKSHALDKPKESGPPKSTILSLTRTYFSIHKILSHSLFMAHENKYLLYLKVTDITPRLPGYILIKIEARYGGPCL